MIVMAMVDQKNIKNKAFKVQIYEEVYEFIARDIRLAEEI